MVTLAEAHAAPDLNKYEPDNPEPVAMAEEVHQEVKEKERPVEAEKPKQEEAKPKKVTPTPPKQVAKPQPAKPTGSCEAEIQKYNWRKDVALAVARAESGLRPNAHNFSHKTKDNSWGCFQINIYGANARTRPPSSELVKPSVNVAFAYKIYVANGHSFIGQWGVCRSKVSCY